ncbi:MAG: NAD(+)/NADH kinase [Thermoleophilaceae bacterium]
MSGPHAPRSVAVFTRRNTEATVEAVHRLAELAEEAGVQLLVPSEEVDKHSLAELPGATFDADPDGADLALVFGGDGTILSTMRRFTGTGTPVFAVNFGAVGFLSTVERTDLDDALGRALRGEYEVLALPVLTTETEVGERLAVNDISFHRRQDLRVAELAYSVQGQELGQVRCDGLVVATPAGSTGYNLANGGPVLAWGVKGYVVSFIAPHTLTARALVVAPDDVLEVMNGSPDEPVDLSTDGRRVCALEPRQSVKIQFREDRALLAHASSATFYDRLREKFGRLSY